MDGLYDELSLRQDRDGGGVYLPHPRSSSPTDKRPPIKLPDEDGFEVNVNALNGYTIHDVYSVDFDSESLGDGGFGTVFQGSHLYEPDTPVAIKKISFGVVRRVRKPQQPPRPEDGMDVDEEGNGIGGPSSHSPSTPDVRRLIDSIENQIAEIAVLKLFRNDYRVVHLHEYFVSTEINTRITSLYLVTEFLPGGELFDCIKARIVKHLRLDPEEQQRRQPFREGDVRDIFRTLLEAIRFMHRHNVIHRDLKPSNLLLQMKDVPTSLKVADFGQSKIIEAGETTRTSTGTPGYRPPEMYAGEAYRESVDLFSAGCILFFLLAGYQPFASYPKHKIKSKTLRCEYRTNVDSWNRVSKPAKKLVKGLLATADRRLTLDGVLTHEWMCQEDGTEDLRKDLTENVKCLVLALEDEAAANQAECNNYPHPNQPGNGTADANANANTQSLNHHPIMPEPLESRRSSGGVHRSAPHTAIGAYQPPSSRAPPPATTVTPETSSSLKGVQFTGHDAIPAAQSQRSVQSTSSSRSLPPYHPEPVLSSAAPLPRQTPAQESSIQRHRTPARTPASSASTPPKSGSGRGLCDCLFGRSKRDPDQDGPTATALHDDVEGEDREGAAGVVDEVPERLLSPDDAASSGVSAGASRDVPMSSPSLPFVRDYSPQDSELSYHLRDLVHVGMDVPSGAAPLLDSVTANVSPVEYTEAVARTYVRALFEAVICLHAQRVVHRNLSVSNFLVSDTGRVIIKDMRFACETVVGQDCLSGYCGTPYIITAPEVYTDFSYSEKVDLWSLGIVTYLLLCGVYPFFGTGNEPELRRMAVQIYYPFSSSAPSSAAPSSAARGFVQLLLQPDPRNRPSAQEMMRHEWMQTDDELLRRINLEFAFGGFSVPGGFD
jgi:serine/threonine protein kinase